MKKPTYKAIDAAAKVLRSLKLEETIKIEELKELAEQARGDYDERSEKWHESEAGEEEIGRIDALDKMVESLERAQDELAEAIVSLEEIETNAPEGAFD